MLLDFLAGASTAECEAYRAQMRAIDNANPVAMANYQRIYKSLIEEPYKSYLIQTQQLAIDAARSASTFCSGVPEIGSQLSCDVYTHNNNGSAYYTVYPSSNCESVAVKKKYGLFTTSKFSFTTSASNLFRLFLSKLSSR